MQLTQSFFESVTNHIRAQAETGDATAREMAQQARRGQEASQVLARESADAYMDFLNSMFTYYQRSAQEAEETTGRKPSRTR